MKSLFGNRSNSTNVVYIFFLILIVSLVFSTDVNAQRHGFGRGGGFGHFSYRSGHFASLGHGYYNAPRIGARFRALPFGYVPFWLDGLEYYYYGGIYYRYYPDDAVYEVVEKPKGADTVSNLKFDQVKMYDGSVLEGTFIGATDSTITLKIGDKNHDININDVISVNFAPSIPPNNSKKK